MNDEPVQTLIMVVVSFAFGYLAASWRRWRPR